MVDVVFAASQDGQVHFAGIGALTRDDLAAVQHQARGRGSALVRLLRGSLVVAKSTALPAVYLAHLTPDPVDHAAVATLNQFAHVQDLSEAIQFANGWHD